MMTAEISYDLDMTEDMDFVEGTFRLPGLEWQIVIVSRSRCDGNRVEVSRQTWDSGVSGFMIRFPVGERINAESVERVLTESLGIPKWVRLPGPDSMVLR